MYSKQFKRPQVQEKSGSFKNDKNVYFLVVFWLKCQTFDFSQTRGYDFLKGTIKSYHPWKIEQIWMYGSKTVADYNAKYAIFGGF